MTNSNDPNRRTHEDTSYIGWIIGGALALAVILAIFAFGRSGDQSDTAANNRANSSATTSHSSPPPPSTSGSSGTTSNSPPATNR